MIKLIRERKKTTIALVLLLALTTQAFKCDQNKTKALAKAADDCAAAQKSTATIVQQARDLNQISAEDLQMFKRILLDINTANGNIIDLAKSLVNEQPNASEQQTLLTAVNKVSILITRLNNEGLLRIKDPAKQAAFAAFVLAMQGAVSSVVVILVRK